jgi:hypothetical protein
VYNRIESLYNGACRLYRQQFLPSHPCERLMMEYIGILLWSMALERTGIMSIVHCLTKIVTYLPCRQGVTSQNKQGCLWNPWSPNMVYQTISPPITTKWLTVDFETEFVPTSASVTNSHQHSTWRQ